MSEEAKDILESKMEEASVELEAEAPVVEEAPVELSVEDRARAKGWRPKEELKNKDDFVSAEVFLDRGQHFDRMKDLNKQIEALVKYNEKLAAKSAEAELRGYNNAVIELQAQRKLAEENEDVETVREIDKRINIHKNQMAQAQQNAVPDEARELAQKYNLNAGNPLLQRAIQIEQGIMALHPGLSNRELYAKVDEALALETGQVKKEAPAKRAPVNPVAPAMKGSTAKAKDSFSIHDLSDEAKSVYKGILSIKKASGEEYTVNDFVSRAKALGTDEGLLK